MNWTTAAEGVVCEEEKTGKSRSHDGGGQTLPSNERSTGAWNASCRRRELAPSGFRMRSRAPLPLLLVPLHALLNDLTQLVKKS